MLKTPFSWTDQNVEILRDMLALSHSAAEVAARIGCGRRAVIGKAWRMNIPMAPNKGGGASPLPLSQRPKAKPATKAKPTKPSALLQSLTGMGIQTSKDIPTRGYRHRGLIVGDAAPVRFADLREFQCKWILNDMNDPDTADSLCCGAEMDRGSYCEHHALLAYRPRVGGSAPIMDRRARV